MPRMHPGQWEVLQTDARFKVLACGRRWGKTLLGAVMCLGTALEGGNVWWVAPDFPRAKIAWRMLTKLIVGIPGVRVLKGEGMILFPTGGFIQIKSAVNPDSLRGEGLHLVVIDECADVAEEAWIDSLRPALTDHRGSALFIGTPKGRNWFHGLFQRAKTLGGWAAFQMPTSTNPFISRAELIVAEIELPKRTWDQEYLAKFVTFEGRVYEMFDPDGPWVFTGYIKSDYKEHFGGIDFGYRNPTSMVVGGERTDGELDIVDEVYEKRLSNPEVIDNAKRLQDQYDIRMWWADPSSPAMIEELQSAGLPIEGCPRSSGGQESVVQWEVRLVSGLLEETRDGRPAPALRIRDTCSMAIKEHDGYRYPKKAREDSPEKEVPLKKNDHSCNAVQYMVHGLSEWYGWDASGAKAAGEREASRLPT